MQKQRDSCQISIKYRKIYSKVLKDLVKIIKMYLKAYHVQLEHYIHMHYKVIYGIEL